MNFIKINTKYYLFWFCKNPRSQSSPGCFIRIDSRCGDIYIHTDIAAERCSADLWRHCREHVDVAHDGIALPPDVRYVFESRGDGHLEQRVAVAEHRLRVRDCGDAAQVPRGHVGTLAQAVARAEHARRVGARRCDTELRDVNGFQHQARREHR